MIVAIAAIVIVFFVVVFLVVMRGSTGLLKKRLEEDPDLAEHVDPSDLDGMPSDVEY